MLYRLARLFLITAVFVSLYSLFALTVWTWPAGGFLLVALGFAALRQRRARRLTTLGSARWATESNLRAAGMLDAHSGLILGRPL